jgi:hypothetical protein
MTGTTSINCSEVFQITLSKPSQARLKAAFAPKVCVEMLKMSLRVKPFRHMCLRDNLTDRANCGGLATGSVFSSLCNTIACYKSIKLLEQEHHSI